MTRFLPLVLLLFVALPAGFANGGDDEDGGAAHEGAPAFTAEAWEQGVRRAFTYLDDRLWRQPDQGSSGKQYAAAAAGWAYLLAGERTGVRLPSRTRELKRIRDYLEQYVKEVERVYDEERDEAVPQAPPNVVRPPGFERMSFGVRQYCWGLGMAGLFFAESHERGKESRRCKRILKRLVPVLAAAQQENGGWGHDDSRIPGLGVPEIPIPKPGGGTQTLQYPPTLLAATNCAAAGLGAACRIVRPSDRSASELAIQYFRQAQSARGTFPYDPSQTDTGPRRMPTMAIDTARTAGSVFALHCLGIPASDPMLANALEVLDANPEDVSEGHGSAAMSLCFGALAARARGDEAWAAFRDPFFPLLLAAQDEEGAFACVCRESPGTTCDTKRFPGISAERLGRYGEAKQVYVTALYTLVLLLDRAPLKAVPPVAAPREQVTPR